jgi:hypothetical protein
MPYDINKLDLVIQYALLVAGLEDDYFNQLLGPIHLIKYVYIADLANARRNNGETYTGVEWKFYKFGPWSQSVNERIEPALTAIHANQSIFQSDFEDRENWVRWNKHDENLLQTIERQLPPFIIRDLKRDVHKFGKDTPSLLDYVYKTNPMLSAAPNDLLDFSLESSIPLCEERNNHVLRMNNLSKKKQKNFAERIKMIREDRNSKASKKIKLVTPPTPRYDEVYSQGLEFLERQAGPDLSEKFIVVEFSDEVWKSKTRKAKDVS